MASTLERAPNNLANWLDVQVFGSHTYKPDYASGSISSEELLKDIDLDNVPIDIKCSFLSMPLSQSFHRKNVYFRNDIISNLVRTGNWYNNLKEDHVQFETIVKECKQL